MSPSLPHLRAFHVTRVVCSNIIKFVMQQLGSVPNVATILASTRNVGSLFQKLTVIIGSCLTAAEYITEPPMAGSKLDDNDFEVLKAQMSRQQQGQKDTSFCQLSTLDTSERLDFDIIAVARKSGG
jgi:hypothetical protein